MYKRQGITGALYSFEGEITRALNAERWQIQRSEQGWLCLLYTSAQLLGFQRILQAHAAEQFRGEVRDAGEAQVLAFEIGRAHV